MPSTGIFNTLFNTLTGKAGQFLALLGVKFSLLENDPRCRAEIAVGYSTNTHSSTTVSTTVAVGPSHGWGPAKRLRLVIKNEGHFPFDCQPYVTRVFINGRVDKSSTIASPLEWTDVPVPDRWKKKRIEPDDEVPFEICHADSVVTPILNVPSESAQFGRFRYTEKGIYTVEVHLRIGVPLRTKYIQTDIHFDPKKPLETDFKPIKMSRRKPKGLLISGI
jgi:hypothetical protein